MIVTSISIIKFLPLSPKYSRFRENYLSNVKKSEASLQRSINSQTVEKVYNVSKNTDNSYYIVNFWNVGLTKHARRPFRFAFYY